MGEDGPVAQNLSTHEKLHNDLTNRSEVCKECKECIRCERMDN